MLYRRQLDFLQSFHGTSPRSWNTSSCLLESPSPGRLHQHHRVSFISSYCTSWIWSCQHSECYISSLPLNPAHWTFKICFINHVLPLTCHTWRCSSRLTCEAKLRTQRCRPLSCCWSAHARVTLAQTTTTTLWQLKKFILWMEVWLSTPAAPRGLVTFNGRPNTRLGSGNKWFKERCCLRGLWSSEEDADNVSVIMIS